MALVILNIPSLDAFQNDATGHGARSFVIDLLGLRAAQEAETVSIHFGEWQVTPKPAPLDEVLTNPHLHRVLPVKVRY